MEKKKKQGTRISKMCTSCIKDNCNHEGFVTCITGLYNCQWEDKLEKQSGRGPCCCSWVQKDVEIRPPFWDVGNMGWSRPPWGLISSRTGHAWALVLPGKVRRNPGAKVNLTETCARVLTFTLHFSFSSPPLLSFIYSFTHFCFYSLSEPWRKSEV